jgi:hypothetical protein
MINVQHSKHFAITNSGIQKIHSCSIYTSIKLVNKTERGTLLLHELLDDVLELESRLTDDIVQHLLTPPVTAFRAHLACSQFNTRI